jgi:hypothetical protein
VRLVGGGVVHGLIGNEGCFVEHKKSPRCRGRVGSVLGGRYRPKLSFPTSAYTKIIEASLAGTRAGCRPTTGIVMTRRVNVNVRLEGMAYRFVVNLQHSAVASRHCHPNG